jgi:hypothetical protein
MIYAPFLIMATIDPTAKPTTKNMTGGAMKMLDKVRN